jgi:murein L,D-transpeptidase YafK
VSGAPVGSADSAPSPRRYRLSWRRPFVVAAVGLITSLAGLLTWANWPAPPLPPGSKADRIVVHKAARELVLLSGGRELRRYRVSLGAQPRGAKEREGDQRTPEGLYRIDYRKADSSFHLALHVSYPDERDRERARRAGVDPGGLIMIHGLPNRLPFVGRLHRLFDWTAGCIAVSNDEIEQIWTAVEEGAPVEIRP